MTKSQAKVRSAPDSVWRPPRVRRALRTPRHLLGLGLSLLVGAVVLGLIALMTPPPVHSAVAAPVDTTSADTAARTPSRPATHAGGQPASTVSGPASGTRPTAPSHPAKPVAAPVPAKTAAPATIRIEIRYGDTLWALARQYGTSVEQLQRLNGLGSSTLIYAGRYLRVPSGHGAVPTSGSAPASSPSTGVLRGAAAAVAYAKAQIGKPYLWGGTGPHAFDCSGLVMRAWQAGGVTLPRTTYDQANAGRRISRAQLMPGDLVFTNGFGHVQLYIGHGAVIEAPHTGATIWSTALPAAYQVDGYVRVAPIIAASSTAPAAAAPTHPAPSPTATATAHTSPAFKGIYAFSGGNSAALAGDPDVAGTSLVYYWAQLEPQPGVYRWDLIDKDIAPWATAGKKVILRVAAGGWASWDKAADSAHATPAWVYAQGVKSVTEKDGAILPQYWNPVFQRDLATFVHVFAARYDGNPHVALIDAAVGIGGETKPDSEKNPNLPALWNAIGYSDPLWWTTVTQTISLYTSAFHATPVAVMPDKTFLGNTPGYNEAKTLAFALAHGAWLQDNGLIPGRALPSPWGRTPIVSEQRGPTAQTGDSLAADLHAAVTDHAALILVFAGDLTNPANRAVIHQYATSSTTTPPTGAPSKAQPHPQTVRPGSVTSTPRPSAAPARRTR